MRTSTLRSLVLGAACALTLPLVGCVVAPAPYYGGEVVTTAPPPPQVEYVGAPPVVGYLWIGGFWSWRAGRHVWIGGHWEAPRPGYHWAPHEWQRQGPGWYERPGHWERR